MSAEEFDARLDAANERIRQENLALQERNRQLEALIARKEVLAAQWERDIVHVRAHLREIVTPEEAERWLDTQHTFLNKQTPRHLIQRGQLERIMEAVAQVKYGIHV